MTTATVAAASPTVPTTKGRVTLFSQAKDPTLELEDASERAVVVPFVDAGPGRMAGERRWVAEPTLPKTGAWRFRVALGEDVFDAPVDARFYETELRTLWLQDKQLFGYEPAHYVSPSRVVKVEAFKGSLPTRSLYIYLPRGYDEHTDKRYPVLYMHDGQNVFQTFVEDSYAGSWRADATADALIQSGLMQECLIVGVSNGSLERMREYLPPYASFKPRRSRQADKPSLKVAEPPKIFKGGADETLAYYRDEVGAYLSEHYRVLEGREHTATCGASMGGLFSAYIAWEQPEFAKHHALMSSSFWITRNDQGQTETTERFRTGEPTDVRIWLDSGTGDPDSDSNDNMYATEKARDALLANGFEYGPNFQYYLDQGAIHHESAWAARLDKVFRFLMPVT
ncbi:hypothetical protein BH24DEI2_BH24DEI2_17880 [soil metagenome]